MLTLRGRYLGLVIGTIAAGMIVHFAGGALAVAPRDILGDALWAAMMYWLIAWSFPRAGAVPRTAAALAICFAVEFGQLINAGWLEAVRSTAAGHLMLGSDFDPRDLLAYATGVVVAAGIDRSLFRRASAPN